MQELDNCGKKGLFDHEPCECTVAGLVMHPEQSSNAVLATIVHFSSVKAVLDLVVNPRKFEHLVIFLNVQLGYHKEML